MFFKKKQCPEIPSDIIRQMRDDAVNGGCSERIVNDFIHSGLWETEEDLRDMLAQAYTLIDIDACLKEFHPSALIKDKTFDTYNGHMPDAIYGAIYGDICGSTWEGQAVSPSTHIEDFLTEKSRPTDDTVMTLATCQTMMFDHLTFLRNTLHSNTEAFARRYISMAKKYPGAGYGAGFIRWIHDDQHNPYGSRGNGSAMRVSPVAMCSDFNAVITLAACSAACTHNHVEGVKGACVEAVCVRMAIGGAGKDDIFKYGSALYGKHGMVLYPEITIDTIRNARAGHYIECEHSVPVALAAVNESDDFESAVIKAMTAGPDTDTNACIAGAIAGALYGIPEKAVRTVNEKLDDFQRNILEKYIEKTEQNSRPKQKEETTATPLFARDAEDVE